MRCGAFCLPSGGTGGFVYQGQQEEGEEEEEDGRGPDGVLYWPETQKTATAKPHRHHTACLDRERYYVCGDRHSPLLST